MEHKSAKASDICLLHEMTNQDEIKDTFYDDLDSAISATSWKDKLNPLGDIDAGIGIDNQTLEGVIGTEGVGMCNGNGLLPLRKCAEHELLITNTVFHIPARDKISWMHLCSKCWHLIDSVIVRRKDRQDVWCRLLDRSQACCQHSTCAFSLYDNHKARKCQRDWVSSS